MDLKTDYLGLQLAHPLIPGASPLVDDLDMARRMEDAGASAVVMHSLFAEQIEMEERALIRNLERHTESFSEARSFLPAPGQFRLSPDKYLDHIARLREAVDVPVIASLNGTEDGSWIEYAKWIEEAGAHALELNLYFVSANADHDAATIESIALDAIRSVRQQIKIPLAIKLAPYFSALPHFIKQTEKIGANGVVLFNRFYQPDIDIDELEALPSLKLSNSSELPLRLRWAAILHGTTRLSIAVSGGVHTCSDVIKAIMAGADCVQLVSAILLNGPEHFRTLLNELRQWLSDNAYESLQQMRGSMSYRNCPDPGAFVRGNYLRILNLWKG